MAMELSIIILNYKTAGLVKHCIKNAQESLAGSGIEYEILLVDNGSHDGCLQMAADLYPSVRCIQTGKNLGFAAGNNAGIRAAAGKYYLILTPDVTVRPGAVARLVEFMRAHPDCGLAGPRLVNPDGTFQISCRTFQTPKMILLRRTPLVLFKRMRAELDRHLMADFDHAGTRQVDWVTGACMIVSRAAVERVGAFDERFFFYVEDMEWCRRMWMGGFSVYYVADAEMVHLWEQASATDMWAFFKLKRLTRWHIASWFKYYLKYFRNDDFGSAPSRTGSG